MSERILVVDDDAPIRRTFDEHLSEAGYEVRLRGDLQPDEARQVQLEVAELLRVAGARRSLRPFQPGDVTHLTRNNSFNGFRRFTQADSNANG